VQPDPGGRVVTAAALLLTALAVLAPPDIVPWSQLACVLVAAAGFVHLAFHAGTGGGQPGPRAGAAPLLLMLPFALASVAAAACRARAVDETAAAVLLLVAAALGAALGRGGRDRRGAVLVLLAGLGAVVALQAILQARVLWPRQIETMRGLDPAANPLLARLLDGRPSGPFSLPAALGGFLVISLAASAGLLRMVRGSARRVPLVVAVALQIYALFLTRSFGALLALVAAVAVILPAADRRVRRAALAAALVVALGGAVWFARGRRVEFAGADRTDPLTLRAGNWDAAIRMIGAHPILGVGPGAFGTFYPRTMRPGMNETRYAHNSYLQAVACWGAWIALPIGVLLVAFAGAARRAWRGERGSGACGLAILAGAGSFLAHNGVDFTAYQPGVALPAALLFGLAIGGPAVGGRIARGAARAGGVALALLLVAHAIPAARSRQALLLARAAAEERDITEAAERARRAIAVRPGDPDPHQFLAELILAEQLTDLRAEGERAAAAALRLDPEAAILHHDRALYHHLAGEGAAAYREEFLAHRLNPLKSLYREGLRSDARDPAVPPRRQEVAP
jgi:O-antigen ligase